MKTILVVEDERPLLDAIEKKLQQNGYNVAKAQRVEEARTALKGGDVDLLWVDHYLLGTESGLALVSELKSLDSPHRSLPIVVVSNTASPEKVQSYISFGVDKYYTKSNHDLAEIITEIDRLINAT